MPRKKTSPTLKTLLLVILFCLSATASWAAPPPRLLAAQFLYLEYKSLPELEKGLEALRSAGVNTIIVRAFQNRQERPHALFPPQAELGVYFPTRKAPLVADLLTPVCHTAHKLGMKVFALMTTRRCDWKAQEDPDLLERAYKPGGDYLTPGLNIFQRQVIYYLSELYQDLARQPIDGILFQDDLVLRNTEGVSRQTQAFFQEEMKRPLNPAGLYAGVQQGEGGEFQVTKYSDAFWEWTRWKNKHLMQLAQTLMRYCRQVKPEMLFALNIYYETIIEPKDGLAWLSQDLATAMDAGFDYYALMAYHRQMAQETGCSVEESLPVIAEMGREMQKHIPDPSRIWIKVQARDWKDSTLIPPAELGEALAQAASVGPVSLAYVPQEGTPSLEVLSKYYGGEAQVKSASETKEK